MEHPSGFVSVAFHAQTACCVSVDFLDKRRFHLLLFRSCIVTFARVRELRVNMPVNFNSPSLPPTLRGMASVDQYGIPRFWATIWIDVLKPTMESSTRRKHLTALDRLYEACNRQRGRDCLDRLIADADADGLENVLLGFLAQLRNEAVITGFDKASTWTSAVSFVIDMLRYTGNSLGARAAEMEAKLLRLEVLYRQLAPNPEATEGPVVRALPSTVVQDLYEIFRPDSARNPFKTEALRWRNLVIFMLLLRLGLRRGEAALLCINSFKEDFNYDTGAMDYWLDVEETRDGDPRYEQPSLKTAPSRRQLPLSKEFVELIPIFAQNFRGKANYPHLLISQKSKPLSLRSMNEIFEVASKALSPEAKKSLSKQGLGSVSCHDLRHTSAVVRMTRYRDKGLDLDTAQGNLREYFGWSEESNMPRLYAKAYFETTLAEVWDETFDTFVDALRRIEPPRLCRRPQLVRSRVYDKQDDEQIFF